MGKVTKCATLKQLEDAIEGAGDNLLVVDFFAEWCGPCRVMAPKLEQWAKQFEGEAEFVKVDIEENTEAAAKYDIQAMPTFLLIRDAEVVSSVVGADPQKLLARIRAALGASTLVPHA